MKGWASVVCRGGVASKRLCLSEPLTHIQAPPTQWTHTRLFLITHTSQSRHTVATDVSELMTPGLIRNGWPLTQQVQNNVFTYSLLLRYKVVSLLKLHFIGAFILLLFLIYLKVQSNIETKFYFSNVMNRLNVYIRRNINLEQSSLTWVWTGKRHKHRTPQFTQVHRSKIKYLTSKYQIKYEKLKLIETEVFMLSLKLCSAVLQQSSHTHTCGIYKDSSGTHCTTYAMRMLRWECGPSVSIFLIWLLQRLQLCLWYWAT